jgi:hypothetical protein
MARILVALTLLPICLATAWAILRRPFREICEELVLERARERFRGRRERLEARFVTALGQTRSEEADRWADADWQDDVVWARDRRNRNVLALVGVHFDPAPFTDDAPRYSTALFEFRDGEWIAEGRFLDELKPDEAVLLNLHLEPVALPPRRSTEAGGTVI